MRKISFLIALASLAISLQAQDNSFLLYSFKGSVSVIQNKAETKALIGKMLSPSDELKLGEGSIVTLICNQASMFTLKKAGTYSLSKFKDSCNVSSSSMSANYIKYVWNQMTSHEEGSPGSNRKMFMNTVGAVSRSVNNIWIDPRLDTVNYSVGDFPLSWKSYSDADAFEFLVYNPENTTTPVYTATITKMKVSIPSFLDKLKTGNSYLWTTAVKGEQNDELKVLNYVSADVFAELLNTFKNQGSAYEAPAEQSYRIAFMLEDAHYLAEAYQYYLKAATTAPDNSLYRSTLMSFKKDYEIK